jgi:6-phosphogluconolactonase
MLLLLATVLAVLVLSTPGAVLYAAGETPDRLWVYVGTYTNEGKSKSKGIYRFELDLASGKLTPRGLAGEGVNPSFLAIAPDHRHLYAVSEIGDYRGKKTGGVKAYAIDQQSGKLTPLNEKPSGGENPCYIVTDRGGKHVLVANYGSGNASVLAIDADGRLGERTAHVQDEGKGPNAGRQEGPHGHSINLDRDNRFAFLADLGIDKVMIFRYDAATGKLTPNDPPSASVPPSSGPRHFSFSPDGKHAYAINELRSTVTAFDYDPRRGTLKALQTISTLPEDFRGENTCAEVQVHPSGKFLYGSNRGHNSIAVFKIDPQTGELTEAGRQDKDIKVPRNFALDPTGKWLIVANQDGDSLVVFRIDQETGALEPTGHKVEVPMPVCVRMMAPPGGEKR